MEEEQKFRKKKFAIGLACLLLVALYSGGFLL